MPTFGFILLLALTFSPHPLWAQTSLIEQVQQSQDSIVTIQAQRLATPAAPEPVMTPDGKIGAAMDEKTGAGIIIDPTGFIVTNTHIVAYAQFIFAILQNGTRLPATVATIAPDSDFTILKIDPPSPLRAMPWADSNTVSLGEDIIAIAHSPLWRQTISGGTIQGIGQSQSQPGNVELIETNLNLDQGDSGGPILDRRGRFLGLIVAKNMKVQRSSFAIPSNKIRLHFLDYLREHSLR